MQWGADRTHLQALQSIEQGVQDGLNRLPEAIVAIPEDVQGYLATMQRYNWAAFRVAAGVAHLRGDAL